MAFYRVESTPQTATECNSVLAPSVQAEASYFAFHFAFVGLVMRKRPSGAMGKKDMLSTAHHLNPPFCSFFLDTCEDSRVKAFHFPTNIVVLRAHHMRI